MLGFHAVTSTTSLNYLIRTHVFYAAKIYVLFFTSNVKCKAIPVTGREGS
jgi:hypothetical protein